MDVFEQLESRVRSYCHAFPTVFERARGSILTDESGREYIDFFAGAGTLSYGHNHPEIKRALIAHLEADGVTHSLDMMTSAKREFLQTLANTILKPRSLDYVVQFPNATGTNAVEAALKLARKVTGRHNVVTFTGAFHGMTLGSLSVTGNASKRRGAHVPLPHATVMPYCDYLPTVDGLDLLESCLDDPSSGVDAPAAVIVETIQAEGGVRVASVPWLKRLSEITRSRGILLIVDDIQVGCGRTGSFFSFEEAGIEPDVVLLSKALGGYGLPFSIVLLKREHDVWEPGEHNGTFRGHNLAFVGASSALQQFWKDDAFSKEIRGKSLHVSSRLKAVSERFPEAIVEARGRGFIQGLLFSRDEHAAAAARVCFERGLVIETAGARDEVLKFLAPLTIEQEVLDRGLDILEESVESVVVP